MARNYHGTSQSGDHWFHVAVRYLARFDRTAAQVEAFLNRKGASAAEALQIVSRLTDLRYLDDQAYAGRWIQSRLARAPIGRERLRVELCAKGLSEDLIEDVLGAALRHVDEEQLARRALEIRQRRTQPFSRPRASRLLHQWGFAEGTITRILKDYREGTDAEP